MANIIARRFIISGRVQGVFFRWFAKEIADRLGLKGWVRNLPNGKVEVWAEGKEDKIRELRSHLQQGPPEAYVTSVQEKEEEPRRTYTDFSISHFYR
ncbi:MAG: acylphosphatase [Candidatus Aminicenantes bacterium]|nr:acylphosphatase [Candidatus Aminicenantes bacterium]MDH5715359.1 acylphosphatase [Candidatus Aminicenantes bacterium]